MVRVDPWEKAADCARAAQAASDPKRQAILTRIQRLWMALANESGLMTEREAASEAERIGRLHRADVKD